MMHECPRCGFVQPQDRYCANCGLDIDHFKPAPRPLFRRVTESTAFQVCLAILIVLGLGSWIYFSQKQTIDEKLKAALNLASPNKVAIPEAAAPPVANNAAQEIPSAVTAAAPPPPAVSPPPAPAEKAAVTGAKELNIQFVELSRLYLAQLAQEHQVVDETAATRSIVMASQPNVSSFREKDPQATVLPGGDTHSVRASRMINLDYMHLVGGPNEVAGMTLEITPMQTLEQSTEITVNGTVTLRAPDGSTANYGFDGKYILPNSSTLIVSGILPHQTIRPEDQENFAGTPLVILSSPEFVNNTSDLVLVIQPK
jgi:hypothetical protein